MSPAIVRDIQKDAKKRFNEMVKMTNSTYAKFLSVYRFKTPSEEELFDFSTSMHYYKRDLSPIKENLNKGNPVSPYMNNLVQYQGNIVTQAFKNNMIRNLGSNSFCITQKSFMTGRENQDKN